jgi:hypothetical protein
VFSIADAIPQTLQQIGDYDVWALQYLLRYNSIEFEDSLHREGSLDLDWRYGSFTARVMESLF